MKKLMILGSLLVTSMSHASVNIENCVIRESIPGATSTAAYVDINYDTNADAKTYRYPGAEMLQRVEVKGLSKQVELHDVKMKNGTMSMFQITRVILNKPLTQLKPGAEHIMLMDLNQPAVVGETYQMNFIFAYGPEISCEAVVKSVADINQASAHHKGH
ncbi:copper chaperone PCu(A)C [Shewanella sp. 5_MG-2023]|uniref:copper chaperone PCu(A)C n=1 Tax=Shewanella sp. 5_MG-2023 TaxID=3062656 RepID=UPI0026E2AF84|nr:copper chaperone PCu(A)C [Shewanella sp. 5_MG-2023]MDO6640139.1 copper chaperone PCu(A)C [Shewanella sp. 5_MG-2023]